MRVNFNPYNDCISYQIENKETIYVPKGDRFALLMDVEDPEKCIGAKIHMSNFYDLDDDLLFHLISLKLRYGISIIQRLKILYSVFKELLK